MEYIQVEYNEKRLQSLDMFNPTLILEDGEEILNFKYTAKGNALLMVALDKHGNPERPSRMWSFSGLDLSTYFNHIKYIQFDKSRVMESIQKVYPKEDSTKWESEFQNYYNKILKLDHEMCEARETLEKIIDFEIQENKRKYELFRKIANERENEHNRH